MEAFSVHIQKIGHVVEIFSKTDIASYPASRQAAFLFDLMYFFVQFSIDMNDSRHQNTAVSKETVSKTYLD